MTFVLTGRWKTAAFPHSTLSLLKPLVFAAALGPAALLIWHATQNALGPNPIEEITHRTGLWALRFLLITLAVTPIRRLTGWHAVIRMRRMLGLFAFFYATLHFLTYVVLDRFFAFNEILPDIAKRPYITMGFTAFVLLIPLAITSTSGMIRRLGGKRWQRLHRLIYVSASCGVVHYLWLVKADLRSPLTYGFVLSVLLGFRAVVIVASRVKGRVGPARFVAKPQLPASD